MVDIENGKKLLKANKAFIGELIEGAKSTGRRRGVTKNEFPKFEGQK